MKNLPARGMVMEDSGDRISDRDFNRLSDLLGSQCGMAIPQAKRVMLETRLRKRVRALGMDSLAAYCDYVQTAAGRKEEWLNLVDAVTTHKTDFFREPAHFDFLLEQAVPELIKMSGAGIRRPLLLWSAACSTGEEPYTLAMVLRNYADSLAPRNYYFRIHASDISPHVLETARLAVYPAPAVKPVPEALRKRYVLRSKDREQELVRMTPEIRSHVEFSQINLMETNYGFNEPFDLVMCRNVIIYFDRSTQQKTLQQISQNLRRGGYLLMGHAESLNGLDLPLAQVAPTVYRRLDG